ncbi:hypothetical protein [Streptomyces sp. NPDC056549]|uniref:hypothetical protein n=1 Tax=Streptomyces sp. NPDC056549 TaxID=3345864 RepID=UPI003688AF53
MHQASSLAPVWAQLADLFAGIEAHGHDVLVDLGRAGAFGPAGVLALRADVVVVVMRGTLRSMHAARSRIAALRTLMDGESGRGSGGLGVLLIRQGPYGPREVEDECGVKVVATLPFRPEEAGVLSDGAAEGRGFMTGKLMSAAREAAAPVWQQVGARRARIASPLQQLHSLGVPGAR